MKKTATILIVFMSLWLQGQCTFTASISASGPTTFCEEGSVDLTVHAASNTWTQKSNFGGSARKKAVSFSIGSKLYVGTGEGAAGPLRDFWEYDVLTNVWTQKADFGGTARFDAVGFSIGNKGYVGTGQDNSGQRDDFWEYDPASDSWVQKSNFPGGSRVLAIGFSIGNKGYMGTSGLTNDFWEYTPTTDSWVQKANVGTYQRYGSVAFSIGNKGYVGGGYLNAGFGWSVTNDFWEYNSSTNTWTQKADLLPGYYTAHIKGFSIGNKGYVGTGILPPGTFSVVDVFSEYNPDANNWVSRASFGGGARWGAAATSVNGKGYICTGQDLAANLKNDVWEYSPTISSYSWSTGSTTSTVSANTTGSYIATVTNVAGCIASVTQTVGVCVGLNESEITGNNPIKIYPNPNNGSFTLNIAKKGRLELFNALGQVILIIDTTIDEQLISIASLTEGIYYLNHQKIVVFNR